MNVLDAALKRVAADLDKRAANDLRALTAVAADSDLVTAREAVELITARGFARDRDLVAALDELLAQ